LNKARFLSTLVLIFCIFTTVET